MDPNTSTSASNLLSRIEHRRKRKPTRRVELLDEPIEIPRLDGRHVTEVRCGEFRIVWVDRGFRIVWVSSRPLDSNTPDRANRKDDALARPRRRGRATAFAAAGGFLIVLVGVSIYSPNALKEAAAFLTALTKLLTTAATLGLAK